ncbi:MAG: helicase [Candidatus Sericytochromatia bacterium]
MESKKIIEIEYGGLDLNKLLAKLKSSNILLNEYAKTIFSNNLFKVSDKNTKISLLITTIKEIGFPNGATIPQIESSLKNYNLSQCPLEVAPYLRLFLNDQEEINEKTLNQAPPESLTVFSKPLIDDDLFPKGFYLRKMYGELWLRGYTCSLDYLWSPKDKFVFKLL